MEFLEILYKCIPVVTAIITYFVQKKLSTTKRADDINAEKFRIMIFPAMKLLSNELYKETYSLKKVRRILSFFRKQPHMVGVEVLYWTEKCAASMDFPAYCKLCDYLIEEYDTLSSLFGIKQRSIDYIEHLKQYQTEKDVKKIKNKRSYLLYLTIIGASIYYIYILTAIVITITNRQ
jgi:hypothetical protein